MSIRLLLVMTLAFMSTSAWAARWEYECRQKLYFVFSYDLSGTIIGEYYVSLVECGWVHIEEGGGSSGGGGSGGGTNPNPPTVPPDCIEKRTIIAKNKSQTMGTPVAIVGFGDFDGDGQIEDGEEVDLLAYGLDADYFVNTLTNTHTKAIRIRTGRYHGGLLVYDENRNQRMDNPREMFTNRFTVEGLPTANASVALMEGDRHENGGNEDGQIDLGDTIWQDLYIWLDRNLDGLSTPDEMHSILELDLERIDPIMTRLPASRGAYGYEIVFHRTNGGKMKGELL